MILSFVILATTGRTHLDVRLDWPHAESRSVMEITDKTDLPFPVEPDIINRKPVGIPAG